ncbi:E3 binding domain-containing protein [Streptomyces zhihengii]
MLRDGHRGRPPRGARYDGVRRYGPCHDRDRTRGGGGPCESTPYTASRALPTRANRARAQCREGSGPAAGRGARTPVAPDRLEAGPLLRRDAERAGVDLASVHGSGPGGRVTRHDVERAGEDSAAARPPARR